MIISKNDVMVPAVAGIGETAQLFCIVNDISWEIADTLEVTWYMDGKVIDPDTDPRMTIKNSSFSSPVWGCTFSEPPAGKVPNSGHTKCTISVLTISDIKEDDYDAVINCTWIEPIPHTSRTGHMTGNILNPTKDNPVSIISTSTTDYLSYKTTSECASTAEISWFVSFENGNLIDVDSSKDQITD